MKRCSWLAFGGVLAGLTWSGSAAAQPVPFDGAFDVQHFEQAIGPSPFVTVPSADLPAKGRFSIDFAVTFLTDPFTILNVDPMRDSIDDPRTEVVRSMSAAGLAAGYGLTDKLQLGVWVPMVLRMSGDGLDPATAGGAPGGLAASGLGDTRLEAKLHLYRKDAMRVAALAGVTMPTSFGAGGNDFLGDDLPGGRLGAAVQWSGTNDRVQAGLHASFIFRKPREIYATEVGQQLAYGAALAFKANRRVSLVGELFGRTGLTSTDGALAPVEADAALRVRATESFVVLAGGGAGLVQAIGAPGVRVFASLGWSPDLRDQDGDGIRNQADKCPLQAEDKDGYEDADGCPDEDNDGDKRLDADDKCPNEAEDFDGYQDDDGRPELDNDGDGVPDLQDNCPKEKEDGQAPRPKDGCPSGVVDSDGDGVKDSEDKCPDVEEDKDGYQDDDGCPDKDNDGDGVADDADKCPLCKGEGTMDGCPEATSKATLAGTSIKLTQPIRFDRRNRLRSKAVADDVAAVMLAHPEVTKWLIIVAPRGTGRAAARAKRAGTARAANLVKYLTSKGVSADVLQGMGANADRDKVRIVAREHGEMKKVFVCPARLRAK